MSDLFDNDKPPKNNTQAISPKPRTGLLSHKHLRRSMTTKQSVPGTVTFGDQNEIILIIRGIVERVILSGENPITLGRSDHHTRYDADIDLTPYGALERGVSRKHAKLYAKDDRLYIVDLGSTNGTYLNGKRLPANTPTPIHKGDELYLGRLAVQILFK